MADFVKNSSELELPKLIERDSYQAARADILTLVEARTTNDIVSAEDRRLLAELTRIIMEETNALRNKLKKLARPALLNKALWLVDEMVGLKNELSMHQRNSANKARALEEARTERKRLEEAFLNKTQEHQDLQVELRRVQAELSRSAKIIDKLVGYR